MDPETIEYYNQNAKDLYHTYTSVKEGGIQEYFPIAFPDKKSKILDVGAGSGRDLKILLDQGYDAYGIDGSEKLIEISKENYPILKERLVHSYIPSKTIPFDQKYDGILLAAVLMHIPRENLFDVVVTLKEWLNDHGKLLISIPSQYNLTIENDRDERGRLFVIYDLNELILGLERFGFRVIQKWRAEDSLRRSGIVWDSVLMELVDSYDRNK
jgi:2-polyprenyl-3-methyl-5-hydroxy-6-metoxy-1,4-benzoquinol methylase